MNIKPANKKCPRCSGTGIYAQSGVCFSCNGVGAYAADPFVRVLGTHGDKFFGVTGPVINGKQLKSVARATSAEELIADMIEGHVVQSITEEQARKFFKRYGVTTYVSQK